MKFVHTLAMVAAAALATVNGASIAHDAVKPFAQPTPTTSAQKAAIKFKPQLHISNGCHPYAGVDANGNTSGGLATSGSSDGGCTGPSLGSQVYGRTAYYNGAFAIMYSWYFPKDSPFAGLGHRHDWENVVVWIDNPDAASPKILAVSASAHSGYNKRAPPAANTISGTSPKIDYKSIVVINHALDTTTSSGETQPLIMWDQLTPAARSALETTDFGDANVPMNDARFMNKLADAYFK